MNVVGRAFSRLRQRGPGYLVYLLHGVLWPRLLARLFGRWPAPRLVRARDLALGLASLGFGPARRRGHALALAKEALRAPRQLPGLPGWEACPTAPEVRAAVAAARVHGERVALGTIDGDGRLLGHYGPLPGFEPVDAQAFLPRDRFDLELVLDGDTIAVRKDYRGDRRALEREWTALARLSAGTRAPVVLAVDEARSRLVRSFVPGQTLNDRLVAAGARIRTAQTDGEAALAGLPRQARLAAILERGTAKLGAVVGEDFLAELERQLELVHAAGVTGPSLTFGNLLLDPGDGLPWLFDFDNTVCHASCRGLVFRACRDADRRLLNRLYDRRLLTEAEARALLARSRRSTYAPVDLGEGFTSRGFWSIDSGTGRWQTLNRRALLPWIGGKRVLDLGCHNAVLSLCMLREGAREVVAVELDPEAADAAQELHRIVEWRDLRRYALDLRRADMRVVLAEDWGEFDLVTAFCSLYYLPEDDMARMVRRAAAMAPMLVLQAKTDTRAEAAKNKATKSSPEFLRRLMEENGFPRIETHAPPGFSRPILIGWQR